jgi:hypothetical protein
VGLLIAPEHVYYLVNAHYFCGVLVHFRLLEGEQVIFGQYGPSSRYGWYFTFAKSSGFVIIFRDNPRGRWRLIIAVKP